MPWSSSSSDVHNPLFSSHSSSSSRGPKTLHLPSVIPQYNPFLILLTLLVLLISSSANAAILLARHHRHSQAQQRHGHRRQYPYPYLNHSQQYCNLFVGTWVRDEAYAPPYTASDCPMIDPQFDCQLYGRPDSDYLKYRWAPALCGRLPRFDGVEFLERLRGKTVMFVGDSLGRNQWESLICMISAGMTRTGSPTQVFRGDPLSSFRFLEYDVTISFYRAPYLVDIDVVQGRRVLRLGDISGNGNSWHGVDILSFNTGHWWTHTGSLQGWDFMELQGRMYQDMDRLTAMEYGLRTWAQWIESNVDPSKTAVFFQSVSPSHDNPSEWSSGPGPAATVSYAAGKNCYGETEPMIVASFPTTAGYPTACAGQMRVLTTVLSEMTHPPYLLDITALSATRKDGHPSIYSGALTPAQRANPARSSDCSHWCLPGLPDTWNQLFYTALFF